MCTTVPWCVCVFVFVLLVASCILPPLPPLVRSSKLLPVILMEHCLYFLVRDIKTEEKSYGYFFLFFVAVCE
jgi:hypothetical protein